MGIKYQQERKTYIFYVEILFPSQIKKIPNKGGGVIWKIYTLATMDQNESIANVNQVHGRPLKIHLDVNMALAADSPTNMMPWNGDKTILIDRCSGNTVD